MSIAWNYLDKRSAAMAALKDYRSMKAILATTARRLRMWRRGHGSHWRDALRGVGAWCAKSAGGENQILQWD